jgi:hypothetical protein
MKLSVQSNFLSFVTFLVEWNANPSLDPPKIRNPQSFSLITVQSVEAIQSSIKILFAHVDETRSFH